MGGEYVEHVTTGRSWAQEFAVLYNLLDKNKIRPKSFLLWNNIQIINAEYILQDQLYLVATHVTGNYTTIAGVILGSTGTSCANYSWGLKTTGITFTNASTTASGIGTSLKFYY